MSNISELAAKYARQRDNVEDLMRTVRMAKENYLREDKELEATAMELKKLIDHTKPKALIPIGSKRYVLIHSVNGSYGVYSSIDIIEESE